MLKKVLLGTAIAVAAGSAFAGGGGSGADVSAATEGFGAVETAVNAIGPLMLTAAAAGIVYKWVTAFLI